MFIYRQPSSRRTLRHVMLVVLLVATSAGALQAPPRRPFCSPRAAAVVSVPAAPPRQPTLRELLNFTLKAIPIFIAPTLLSLIDTAAVGRVSSFELAAMGPACAVVDSIAGLFVFVSVGATNAAAKATSQSQKARAASVGVVLGAALGALTGALMYALCGPQRFAVLGDLADPCSTYVRVRALSTPATVALMAAQASCLGNKDSASPARATLLAALVNIIGDALLVPSFGVAGAAWATVLCQFVACAACLRALDRNAMITRVGRISARDISDFFAFGGFMIVVLCKTLTYNQAVALAASLGPAASAAHQVVYSLARFCFTLGDTTGATAQAYLPSVLDGERGSARDVCAKVCLVSLLVACFASSLTLAALILTPFIFTADPAVAGLMGRSALPAAIGLLMHPVVVGLEGCLLARQDLKWLVRQYCLTGLLSVFATLALFRSPNLNLAHVWLYLAGYQLARCSSFLRRTFASR